MCGRLLQESQRGKTALSGCYGDRSFCARWSLGKQVVLDVYSILVLIMAHVQFIDF